MELLLANDLVIQCSECGSVIIVDKDSLEIETFSYERQMGAETEYTFEGESTCNECGNYIHYVVRGFEYPEGSLNYDDYECSGGSFIQSPEVAVKYYPFDFDVEDEYYIYDELFKTRINIDRIIANSEAVYDLSSREFEELVAQIFEDNGYKVKLTPETRDGGCDVIATRSMGGIPFMVLIECKKYGRKNKVDISLVRSLLGVLTDQEANKAVLVTSSTFTRDAKRFAERHDKLIQLIDFQDLLKLMRR